MNAPDMRSSSPSRNRPSQGRQNGSQWEGALSVSPRGFGFVTAPGREDVYVAANGVGGALHGDRVKVLVRSRTPRGLEGVIEGVLERRNPRVSGVLRRRARSAWLEPDDTRVRGPIVLSASERNGNDGDAAVVEITRFPAFASENPQGKLLAVLGAPGDPRAEVAKILVREGIAEQHPEGALREAEALAARTHLPGLDRRVDLRQIALPTIDPEDARDHDDAVWVERAGHGYRVWVAIADVSEYVQPESELDQESMSRGCSIYFPDRAIPMLPAALSADLCSLLPDRDRLCLCVIAELDRDAQVKRFEIVEGVMRSAAMLTYGGVAKTLGFTDASPQSPQAEALKGGLRALDELATKLHRARLKRGALDLDLPEARVQVDPETLSPLDIQRRTQDPGIKRAYKMVEEMMLLANQLVARWLGERRCPTIYRVHDKPDQEKLERLGEAARVLRAPFDREQMLTPSGVARWLAQVASHPRRGVLEMLLLRSLKQATYDVVNVGHFGLASDGYLHFTSPIRRFPDIEVHRSVKRILAGKKPDTGQRAIERLRALAAASSLRERAAMEVEREVVDLYRALFMRQHVGDMFDGTVTALVETGAYVTIASPFVDVLVRYDAMGPDRYVRSDDDLSVSGLSSGDRIALGDPITLSIEDVAVLRRTTYGRRVIPAHLLSKLGEPAKGAKGKSTRPKEARHAPSRESHRSPGKSGHKKKIRRPARSTSKRR
jgi:ribonuclease R